MTYFIEGPDGTRKPVVNDMFAQPLFKELVDKHRFHYILRDKTVEVIKKCQ